MVLLGLGMFAEDDPQATTATVEPSTGDSRWIAAGEIARSATVTQPLPGGRWLYQYGSSVDVVQGRSGNMAMVQNNSSGGLYEFTFQGDGSYQLAWMHRTVMYGQPSQSRADERGTWELEGTTLTLQPESQRATYTNGGGEEQVKEDVDLGARRYQVVDITLETVEHTGSPMKRWPGIEISGPGPKWSFDERISVDLQRL